MKTIASLVLATLAISTATPTQAGDCRRSFSISIGTPIYTTPIYTTPVYCAPRLVCTKELYRRIESSWAYDSWGRLYSFQTLVITYADYYSDGTARQYTRSYPA